jgi:hypothetical protein
MKKGVKEQVNLRKKGIDCVRQGMREMDVSDEI